MDGLLGGPGRYRRPLLPGRYKALNPFKIQFDCSPLDTAKRFVIYLKNKALAYAEIFSGGRTALVTKNPAKNHFLKNLFSILFFCFLAVSLGSCSGGGGGGGGGELYSISGTVTSGSSGLAAVTMNLTGTSSATTTTDSNGVYQFSNLAAGSYTITPSKAGYTFNPSSIIVSVTNSNVTGQNFTATAVTWAKTYGGVNDDIAHSISQTSDGGYIVAGETYLSGIGFANFWVLKLNSNGEVFWQKTYGGNNNNIAYSIQQITDGFIVVGMSDSFSNPLGDIWVLKLSTNGEVIWQKTYRESGSNLARYVLSISDGFVVAGETSSSGAGNADFWVLKLDGTGNIGSGCSVIGTSSATVSSTGITAVDSSGTVNNTNATVTQTSVTPQDSTALIATQCSSP